MTAKFSKYAKGGIGIWSPWNKLNTWRENQRQNALYNFFPADEDAFDEAGES